MFQHCSYEISTSLETFLLKVPVAMHQNSEKSRAIQVHVCYEWICWYSLILRNKFFHNYEIHRMSHRKLLKKLTDKIRYSYVVIVTCTHKIWLPSTVPSLTHHKKHSSAPLYHLVQQPCWEWGMQVTNPSDVCTDTHLAKTKIQESSEANYSFVQYLGYLYVSWLSWRFAEIHWTRDIVMAFHWHSQNFISGRVFQH